ncbi:MAG: glycosyltransferase family 2 protein [Treponema sp.]|nr:glycosyltransferase family 2 protein [Treponema sp.]
MINFIRRNRRLFLFAKSLRSIKRHGIRKTIREISAGLRGEWAPLKTYVLLPKHEKIAQERAVFPQKVKISIIVSLCGTPEESVREMIESVVAQTYGEWELCLVDGSGEAHETPSHICETYARTDNRIKYRKSDGDSGISGRLNTAIEMSTGGYLGLLDEGDVLHPSALYEAVKSICSDNVDFIYSDEAVFSGIHNVTFRHHKPGYAPDTLCSHNYIGRFIVFSRALVEKTGVFRSEFDGSHDYDLILRYTDAASRICHIPKLLYFRRDGEKTAALDTGKRMEAVLTGEKAIAGFLKEREKPARVESKIELPGYYRVIYDLADKPLVSIVIPNKDNAPLLRKCLSSISEKTTYENYEIIVVENNSSQAATFALYEELERYKNIRIVHWEGRGFNFSEICNFGVLNARGRHLVFLNNDVLVIAPNWIEEMLMYSQRSDVGAVGAKLYYLNGCIQHAGVIAGLGEVAGHIYHGAPYDTTGYMGKLQIVQNMSAVTAACMMVRREVFEEAGQFAPGFSDSFNDVDLCMNIRKAGYSIVWTPYAEAYHLESRTRGYNVNSEKKRKLMRETALFKAKWEKELAVGDAYYNCNFSLDKTDYRIKMIQPSGKR